MHHTNPYKKLALMTLVSFGVMYILMYAMVDDFLNAVPNLNQFYMAGLMTAAMVIIEIVVMSAMYQEKTKNVFIGLASLLLLIFFWLGIRSQLFIDNNQFLKSMIPHHAGAILMCKNANLEDIELQNLCQNILDNQQAEINLMKQKLEELK